MPGLYPIDTDGRPMVVKHFDPNLIQFMLLMSCLEDAKCLKDKDLLLLIEFKIDSLVLGWTWPEC